ncbi:PREDICTED: proteinase-activated receptor 1-like [Thamnophis sirtalis]|uniref:Proteinase-activated receptor 1 n=1 Tax=Thamnophis sirtalis TaxID=35019 RepID=A0A6I9X5N1_9SAUR|nr:PREDICTED: proteinase-activated receptor 1-like [Thamnophis sirtalis]
MTNMCKSFPDQAVNCLSSRSYSSDQIILSSKPRKLLPAVINSTNDNLPDIHYKERSLIYFLRDSETYFTNPWLTQFLPAVEILAFVLGLPLNALAIHIFVTKTKLWKPAVVYMLNLAFADLVVLSMLPFKIAYLINGHDWVFGPTMCRLVSSTFFCNMYSSVLLMTGISIDRFLALVCPMKSLPWRTARRASVTCFAIWLLAIMGASPLLAFDLILWIPQVNITTCFEVSAPVESFNYYLFALSIFFFFIPLLISTTCYICIIRRLFMARFMVQPGRKRRAIFLSGVVLCTFFLCFGPANILLLMQIFFPPEQLQSITFAHMLSLSLTALNCCLDPLIYYYASSECQRQIWSALCPRKLLLVRKVSQTSSNTAPSPKGLEPSFPI